MWADDSWLQSHAGETLNTENNNDDIEETSVKDAPAEVCNARCLGD